MPLKATAEKVTLRQAVMVIGVMAGVGFTETVNVKGSPGQLPLVERGVMEYVAVCVVLV